MMKIKMRSLLALLALVLCLPCVVQVSGCGNCGDRSITEHKDILPDHDIVVLYTNDVHCAIEKESAVSKGGGEFSAKEDEPQCLGYSSLAAYRSLCLEETPYVTLVDDGDAVQGDTIGLVSQGEYLIDIMNAVGYDFCVLGNHEFDYGMEQLVKLVKKAKAQYLCCNLAYTGTGKPELLSQTQPYAIVKYGQSGQEVNVGFVGISTPESMSQSNPEAFKEDGEFVYSFHGESEEEFYGCIQESVDACRAAGADYVIAVGHLGIDETSIPFTSEDVIAHTRGVDAFIDGHSHSTIPCQKVENLEGQEIILTSTGTKLTAIGRLVIGKDGSLASTLVTDVPETDPYVDSVIAKVKSQYEDAVNEVVAHSDVEISDKGEDGCRLVQCREAAIGDLCADAFRSSANATIGVVVGGGIFTGLPQGDITINDIIHVLPYGMSVACCECTGQEVLDALEFAYCLVEEKASDGTKAVGENPCFLQTSGLKFTIDTSIPSSVVVDDKGMFVKVAGTRRVQDVKVLNAEGEYVPIDSQATYTLASYGLVLKDCFGGFTMFADNHYVIEEGPADCQALIDYIKGLKGDLSDYAKVDDRITVK